jgi:uncharacterized membrane protein
VRAGLILAGAVVVLLGVVLLTVTLVPQPNVVVTTDSSSSPYYEGSVSGFSLTGSIPVSVQWSSSGPSVTVVYAVCSGSCSNYSQVSDLSSQNGSTGAFQLHQPNGGSITLGVVYGGGPVSVTFKISTALTTVGTALVVLGVVLLLLGIVLRRRKPPSPVPAPVPTVPAAPPSA